MSTITEQSKKVLLKKPHWLRRVIASGASFQNVTTILQDLNLNTVCNSAHCPNVGECFSRGNATFLILGNICTRSCRFCAIESGRTKKPDRDEPLKVADAVKRLKLHYVVITSVTRDDLPDFGAEHFAETVNEIRRLNPDIRIELLVPDFKGSEDAMQTVIDSHPDVINHNIETVPRLYKTARPEAEYRRSLSLLAYVHSSAPDILTKSGFMLGLGESSEEIRDVLHDLLDAGCYLLTLGQYLQPSYKHLPVQRFVAPKEFDWWKDEALKMGFHGVASGPFVRSSYNADKLYKSKNQCK